MSTQEKTAKTRAAAPANARTGRGHALRINTILVPVDLTPASGRALGAAKTLAKRFNSKLVLIHVVDRIHNYKDFGYGPVDWDRENTPALHRSHKRLRGLQCTMVGENLHCRAHVRSGDAATEIANAATALKADLIVMATAHLSGPAGPNRASSIAETVFRRAQCPVLLLPARP